MTSVGHYVQHARELHLLPSRSHYLSFRLLYTSFRAFARTSTTSRLKSVIRPERAIALASVPKGAEEWCMHWWFVTRCIMIGSKQRRRAAQAKPHAHQGSQAAEHRKIQFPLVSSRANPPQKASYAISPACSSTTDQLQGRWALVALCQTSAAVPAQGGAKAFRCS